MRTAGKAVLISATLLFTLSACQKEQTYNPTVTEVQLDGKPLAVSGLNAQVFRLYNRPAQQRDTAIALLQYTVNFISGNKSYKLMLMQYDRLYKVHLGTYIGLKFELNRPYECLVSVVGADNRPVFPISSIATLQYCDEQNKRMSVSFNAICTDARDSFEVNGTLQNVPFTGGSYWY